MRGASLARRLWLVLPLLAVAYVFAVLGASRWLGDQQVDLTHDHLYTLSPATRTILAHLDQRLELTLYFSDRASHGLPQLRAYHQRVVQMLDEVARASDGKVRFVQVDPVAYSEDEDRATAAGLTPVRGEGTGEAIFFGLAGRNLADDRRAAIPFFLPAKEPFVEYDIARVLHELSVARKPRVAIFSELPIWGGKGDAAASSAPWTIVEQLRPLFDVERLDTTTLANLRAEATDVLVLIQPAALSGADVGAVDRYVQAGGHLLVFVDPDSEVGGGEASDLPLLFSTWGVEFNPARVLLDRSRALTVQSPVTGNPERDPAVLGLTGDEFNRRDPITRTLNMVDVSSVGYFGLLPNTATRLEPLLQSTTDARAVSADEVRNAVDPASLYEGYKPDGRHYAIAVRLAGRLPAALPADVPSAAPGHAAKVILVADTDLLADRLWVQASPSLGQTLMSPFANNGDFVLNAIDDLAGPSPLMAIRGRAVEERRFTRVDDLRRRADQKFKAKQLELQAELGDTEQQLATLRRAAHDRSGTAAQQAAVAQFVQRKLQIRVELRTVQRNLDADIERLSMQLKFIDILLMPILVTLAGLLYGAWRMLRRRRWSEP